MIIERKDVKITGAFLGSETAFWGLKAPFFGTKYTKYQADSVVPTRGAIVFRIASASSEQYVRGAPHSLPEI